MTLGVDPDELAELLAMVASDDPAEVDRAHARALVAMHGNPSMRAVAAQAYDRARALGGKLQKFGTQAVQRAGLRALWPVDPATTDSERAKWNVGTLAKLTEQAAGAALVGKAPLRRLLRGRRSGVAPAAAADAAAAIARYARDALRQPAHGAVVAAYWPLQGEADPRPLARDLCADGGARLALPVVDGDAMAFREWRDDAALVPAGFGTFGPPRDAAEVVPDVVLVPLVGFDRTGARLGQGKGYYDRAFAARDGASRPLLVGVALSCQELPVVPTDPHDLALDAVVTEREFTLFRDRG